MNRSAKINTIAFKALIICILLFISSDGYGLDTLYIQDGFQKISIENFGGVYTTKEATIDIKRIQKLGNDVFVPLNEFGLTHPPTEDVYWISVIIKNNSEQPVHLVLENTHHTIDSVQFFCQKVDTLTYSGLMGDRVAFESRFPSHRNYLYPIHLQENEWQQIYYHLNKTGGAVDINSHLYKQSQFDVQDNLIQVYNLLYLGFLICICFLTLGTTLTFRQSIITFYAFYCFFGTGLIFSMSGFGYQYLWGSYPILNTYLAYFFTIGMLISFSALTRHFVKAKDILPRFNKLMVTLEFLAIFILLPANFLHRQISKLLVVYVTYFGQLLQIIIIVSVIILSIRAYQKTKNRTYLVYLFSFLFYIVGIVTFFISRFTTWLEMNTWGGYGIYFIWLIDILILMFLIIAQVRQAFINNSQLQEQLSQLQLTAANSLLEGQLEERKRLSQELHEGISIKMALLKMQLNNFFNLKNQETSAIITELDTISENIRAFTHAISPLNLDEETLEDAIEDLVYKLENQTDLEINISLEYFEEQLLNNNQKHNLYQILQELFNNTIKYAEANLVKVILFTAENQLTFNYKDDGNGFDINSTKSGIGLKNIQARIDLLNGTSNIHSDNNGSQFKFSFKI